MSVKIVLENAIAQLEAEKKNAESAVRQKKIAEYAGELQAFTANEKAKLDAAIIACRKAYDESIAAKNAEITAAIDVYVNDSVAAIDEKIEVFKEMLSKEE